MKVIVNPHKITIDKTPVNELEINITKCEFEFAEEITNEFVKEAYFTLNNGQTYKKIIVNNQCDIPGEVLEKMGGIELGVVAYLVENNTEIKRYNPTPAYFDTWLGSLKDAENSEPITPSEMEQYEQALQDGLEEVNEKLDDIDQAIEEVNTAIEETNNLDLDVSKEGKTATVTLTKKDATTKTVTLSDGTSLMFQWDGTKLGIKTDTDEDYTYVDLQGIQGPVGPKGEAFTIKKTYSSVAEMNADFYNMQLGDYVMIASTVEVEDNAKLYTRGESQWIFISDFSGAMGIRGETGLTPNIQIGTVTSGATPSVTRTGTNENPILNFVLVKGETGDPGQTGPAGATGNGIASITKTGTSGLVDTYTITYTDGTTSTFEVTNGQDGEVSQEEIDYVQREIDYYKKYANVLEKETNTNTSISINNTIECPMPIDLTPSEISQEDTPTPDAPQTIHTISGNNTITIANSDNTQSQVLPLNLGDLEYCKIGNYEDDFIIPSGKNIFNPAWLKQGYISNTLVDNRTTSTRTDAILLEAGTYVFQFKYSSAKWVKMVEYASSTATSGSFIFNSSSADYHKTFTLANDTWVRFGIDTTLANVLNGAQIQLEKNTLVTEYEPYNDGKWYLKKNILKLILNGTENWAVTDSGLTTQMFAVTTSYTHLPYQSTVPMYSPIYKFYAWGSSPWNKNNSISYNSTNQFRIKDNRFATLDDFKANLAINNLPFYFVNQTPQYILLDDTLQSQLTEIYKFALSYNEQTNIDQINNDLSFIINTISVKQPNKIWIGTQAEYDEITTPSENTLYFIKDDANASQ